MKHIYILAFCLLTANLFGQSVVFKSDSGEDLTEDTLTIVTSFEDFDISFYFHVYNTAPSVKKISVLRIEEDVLPNTSSYFCWSVCTGVTTSGDFPEYGDPGFVSMSSNPTTSGSGSLFEFHHDPNYQVGTSLFRLHFYDVDNPTDSSNIWCKLITTDSGLGLENGQMAKWPNLPLQNPVDQVIQLEYEYKVALFDLSGKQVYKGFTNSIHTSNLPNGVYLLNVQNELGKTESYRIIIQH